jgi:uncharacterized lipoprotein YmbA
MKLNEVSYMKTIIVAVIALGLTGCATANKEQLYYDASKAISKDLTVAQSACWGAIGEIAKGASDSVKINAIALAEKCKNDPVKVTPPKKNWFGF